MKADKRTWFSRTYLLVLAALFFAPSLFVALFLWSLAPQPVALASADEPQPGTVESIATYVYLPETTAITGTTYTDAPRVTAGGVDVSRISDWHAVDVFVTGDLTGAGWLTVTAQVSADQINWADAAYDYVAQSGTVVNSGAVTSTTTTASSIVAQPYRIILTADGTDYLRLPLAGEYLRFKVERTGTIEATILATLRNN